jgi:hypothetical protein
MPMVATAAIGLLDIAVLRLTLAPFPASLAGEAGARPDHSISGHRRLHSSRFLAVKSPQRQSLPDDGGMEVRAVEQASIIEVIGRIVQWRRTLAVTDEHEAAGHMF